VPRPRGYPGVRRRAVKPRTPSNAAQRRARIVVVDHWLAAGKRVLTAVSLCLKSPRIVAPCACFEASKRPLAACDTSL